jgi:hypothetical protein
MVYFHPFIGVDYYDSSQSMKLFKVHNLAHITNALLAFFSIHFLSPLVPLGMWKWKA